MDALSVLNSFIRSEHGNPVGLDNLWKDTGVDSFGTTMVFCDMDNKYGCYNKEWLNSVDWETLTIRDVLGRIPDEGTKL